MSGVPPSASSTTKVCGEMVSSIEKKSQDADQRPIAWDLSSPYHFSYSIFPLIRCRTKSVVHIAKNPLSVAKVGKMVPMSPGSIISHLTDWGQGRLPSDPFSVLAKVSQLSGTRMLFR